MSYVSRLRSTIGVEYVVTSANGYQLVLGDKEVASRTVSARTRAGENLPPVPLEAFVSRLRDETARRL